MPPFRLAASSEKPSKQAVVLVHGMGEPVPMETLRGFVQTVWVRDPKIKARRPTDQGKGNPVWWKPDFRTGSIELSRITTREADGNGPRTDFYEFYWADLTDANTLIQLKDWFMSLLLRAPYQVPPEVVWVWLLLWVLTIVFGGLSLWQALSLADLVCKMPDWAKGTLGVGVLVYGGLIGFVLAYFGDVARYVRAKPPNIAARREVRKRGLELLRQLHDCADYDRIVLVSHSLGSIVAYDLLRTFWAESDGARKMQVRGALHRALFRLAAAAKILKHAPTEANLKAYRGLQGDVFRAIRDGRCRQWLISDFVTVGSPLAHAQFLMARDDAALRTAIRERRYPTSPPRKEDGRFVYASPSEKRVLYAHHASPFAAVRWTNIYDAAGEIRFLRGDLISGSVTRNFGPGIVDIPVVITRRARWPLRRLFTHTDYWSWTNYGNRQVREVRRALDLLRRKGDPAYPDDW